MPLLYQSLKRLIINTVTAALLHCLQDSLDTFTKKANFQTAKKKIMQGAVNILQSLNLY